VGPITASDSSLWVNQILCSAANLADDNCMSGYEMKLDPKVQEACLAKKYQGDVKLKLLTRGHVVVQLSQYTLSDMSSTVLTACFN
jgi:hypothetical protein